MSDEFTRWLCAKCGCDGIDSWNKAVFDGPAWEVGEQIPDPWIVGMECWRCMTPCVVSYGAPGLPPRAIYSPDGSYEYEREAMELIQTSPEGAIVLLASKTRDADWSRGCLAARAQLQ